MSIEPHIWDALKYKGDDYDILKEIRDNMDMDALLGAENSIICTCGKPYIIRDKRSHCLSRAGFFKVHDWYPDGKSILMSYSFDHPSRSPSTLFRCFTDGKIDLITRNLETCDSDILPTRQLLQGAYVSLDGNRVAAVSSMENDSRLYQLCEAFEDNKRVFVKALRPDCYIRLYWATDGKIGISCSPKINYTLPEFSDIGDVEHKSVGELHVIGQSCEASYYTNARIIGLGLDQIIYEEGGTIYSTFLQDGKENSVIKEDSGTLAKELSWDRNYIAYGSSEKTGAGKQKRKIKVIDTEGNQVWEREVKNIPPFVWSSDSKSIFHPELTEGEPMKVYRYDIGGRVDSCIIDDPGFLEVSDILPQPEVKD